MVPLGTPADPMVVREEVWFPGVHSDVGGTFPDPQPPCRLSDLTLKWVADGAWENGLLVDRSKYTEECSVFQDHTRAPVNSNAWPWRPLSFNLRPLEAGLVHASAQDRIHPTDLTGRTRYADEHWWWPCGQQGDPAPQPWPGPGQR